MVDATGGDRSPWRWVGAVGAVLAIAAFFGIHDFTQLKAAFGDSPPACTPAQKFLNHCGQAYFAVSGSWQKTGPCDDTSCPLSATFENQGTETGSASVTFHLTGGGYGAGDTGSACTAVIPPTPPKGVVAAACTIWSPKFSGTQFGVRTVVNNPS